MERILFGPESEELANNSEAERLLEGVNELLVLPREVSRIGRHPCASTAAQQLPAWAAQHRLQRQGV